MRHELSIAFQTNKPLAAYGPLAAKAEACGFDAITVYNDLLYQPAWLPLLEIARATTRARVGVAAMSPFTCHPINIAGNIALINEASNGRAYVGLARGAWLDYLGLEPKHTVTALREAIGCVRHLLGGSTDAYAGRYFSLKGGERLRWVLPQTEVPILLGTWGEQTMRACLPLIAEVKLGGTANPALVRRTRDFLDRECRAIGREPQEVGIVVGAVSVADRDGAAARALAKLEVGMYLPVVAELDPTIRLEKEWSAAIADCIARGDSGGAASLISDELLSKFAFAGTSKEIGEQSRALFEAGAARIEFGTPHGVVEEDGIEMLGEITAF